MAMTNAIIDDDLMERLAVYMDNDLRERVVYAINDEWEGHENEIFLAAYTFLDPKFEIILNDEFSLDFDPYYDTELAAIGLASLIRYRDRWDLGSGKDSAEYKFCELAGIECELDTAYGNTIDSALCHAADILGVEI